MIVPLLCGALFGTAAWLACRVARGRPVELAHALGDLHRPRPLGSGSDPADPSIGNRIGRSAARGAAAAGLVTERLQHDLRIAERALERHAFEKVLLAAYGAALPLLVVIGLGAAGVAVPSLALAVLSTGCAVGGFLVPDLNLRQAVARRQRDFTFALGAYLELVTVILAGGGGVETALTDAAEAGDGPAFVELRRCLATCRLAGRTPWEAFAQLGDELGVPELAELAASVGLAGEQGAKVRSSLSAKASSLRDHELARTEAEAQSATERMALPLVMLLFGFVMFIGYPAVVRVLTSL